MSATDAHWKAKGQGTISTLVAGCIGLVLGLALLSTTFWPAIALAGGGGMLIAMTGIRSLLWRRWFREAKKYAVEISVVFDENAVHVESAEGKSELKWSFFTWYMETPDYLLLYTTKRHFSVIPKSALPTDAKGRSILDLVKSKLQRLN